LIDGCGAQYSYQIARPLVIPPFSHIVLRRGWAIQVQRLGAEVDSKENQGAARAIGGSQRLTHSVLLPVTPEAAWH
jgi:hypothetical protein